MVDERSRSPPLFQKKIKQASELAKNIVPVKAVEKKELIKLTLKIKSSTAEVSENNSSTVTIQGKNRAEKN